MLRTALIGYPSTGKSTIFQLMTASHDSPRAAHGKLEATLGVARVPDARLDVLTRMFNPRKRVPATVEFADIPGRASGSGADGGRGARGRPSHGLGALTGPPGATSTTAGPAPVPPR
ncbi:MAG: 50S ribosome-binding GTPase, partial [Acidobacteria bacterium]|nr:50S ribosome-binding GTPase [Acidobacteriota bacterium]